jgi:outer membrane protein OmpA-like peptidoglycan-associated protein
MKSITSLIILACAELLVSCATVPPPAELINARLAYKQATQGQAAQLVPAAIYNAQEALGIAERSFKDDPKSYKTRDLAYIADRKSKMAEALAITAAGNASTAKANKDYQATQSEIMKNTKDSLATSERSSALKSEQLATEQKARVDAENKTAQAQTDLAVEQKARVDADNRATQAQSDLTKLAAVKDEARGLVITLSGSVLFASNKSELLPAAQNRLSQVADALMETKERKLTVEGHTDSQGSSSYNQELSQRRADAVRSYIISRGYSSDLIQANGIGKDRPVADNASAEGRADNRRVEIIVDHAAK